MSHIRCDYIDRIGIVGGKLVRTVSAVWNSKKHGQGKFDVYRIDQDGKERVRNMDYNIYNTKMFRNPKDGIERWGTPVVDLESFKCGYTHVVTDEEIVKMKECFPDFKWTFDKCIKRIGIVPLSFAFRLLLAWRKNKNVEYLVNEGLFNLVFNKTFMKMAPKKQMEVVRFIKEHLGGKNVTLAKVQTMIKLGIDEKEYDTWKSFRPLYAQVPYNAYKFLKTLEKRRCKDRLKQIEFYLDYYRMAKKAGHDMDDRYWWNPKDIKKMHDKVMEECRLIDEAKRIRMAKKLEAEEQKKKDDFEKMMKKWNGKSIKMNDIEIYVPRTYEEVDAHAKALHQCLIYADYVKKVIEKKLLLVFVSKKCKPNATAEIKRDGTIGQFYADEHSKNIFPSEVVKNLMNEWIETYKPNLKRGRKAKDAA